jgi:SAM-dependent methyltransferase
MAGIAPRNRAAVPQDALDRLYGLLRCTHCGAGLLAAPEGLSCPGCQAQFPFEYDGVPSFLGPRELLSATEQVELENLERQLEDFYSPDWRVGYNPPRVALIDAALPDGLILDLGAADGQIAAHLSSARRMVIGMEKSSRWLEKHGGLSVPFLIGDVYRVPFDAETFDGAVMGELLEHLYDPAAALAGVVRTLVPGGVLTGTVPNFYFLTKRLRYLAGKFGEGEGDPLTHAHIRFFSRVVLRDLLERAGLREIRITGILQADTGRLPGKKLLSRLQMTAAGIWPELLAVTFFFQAKKI